MFEAKPNFIVSAHKNHYAGPSFGSVIGTPALPSCKSHTLLLSKRLSSYIYRTLASLWPKPGWSRWTSFPPSADVWTDGAEAEPVFPSTATIADMIAENHVLLCILEMRWCVLSHTHPVEMTHPGQKFISPSCFLLYYVSLFLDKPRFLRFEYISIFFPPVWFSPAYHILLNTLLMYVMFCACASSACRREFIMISSL